MRELKPVSVGVGWQNPECAGQGAKNLCRAQHCDHFRHIFFDQRVRKLSPVSQTRCLPASRYIPVAVEIVLASHCDGIHSRPRVTSNYITGVHRRRLAVTIDLGRHLVGALTRKQGIVRQLRAPPASHLWTRNELRGITRGRGVTVS